jgi:hypothetical protein
MESLHYYHGMEPLDRKSVNTQPLPIWEGCAMTTTQAFFLGMMASWTPSLILLAWMLWRDAGSENQSSGLQH